MRRFTVVNQVITRKTIKGDFTVYTTSNTTPFDVDEAVNKKCAELELGGNEIVAIYPSERDKNSGDISTVIIYRKKQ